MDKAPFSEDCYEQMKHAYEKFILKDPFAEGELQKPDFIEVVIIPQSFHKVKLFEEVKVPHVVNKGTLWRGPSRR